MMLRALAIVCLSVVSAVDLVRGECGSPVFREDAQSMVTKAGFESMWRRGGVVYNYKVIEIEYQPFMMVEDSSCIEESQLNLEIKTGAGDWVAVDSKPQALGGGKYKWKVDAVPCRDHMVRFWVNGPGGSSSLEYEQPILAVSEEDIVRSKFEPAAPTGLTVQNAGDNQLEVAWQPVECATSYEISYGKDLDSMQSKILSASQGSQLYLDALTACTKYEISVYAVIGQDLYSAEAATESFITQPEVSSALSLTPTVDRETNYVHAQWQAFDKLSCVDKYAVSVCKEGGSCMGEEEVSINAALNYLEYEMEGLEQCTDYTLHILPLYTGMDLDAKIVEFRTKSPDADGAEENLSPVSAEAGDGQMIYVSWSSVQCAEYYEVFQQVNTGGDWEFVHKTSESSAALAGVPCTEYRYGVSVTIDGVRSQIKEAAAAVMTKLDNSVAFKAPNLEIEPTVDGAVLTWDHGACIPSYVVRVCPTTGDLTCEEFTVIRDSTVHNITHEVDQLDSCSQYSLEILPQIEGQEFEPDRVNFRTEFPVPSPPADFSAEYRKGERKVEFEWSEVECSSGYVLVRGESQEKVWETDDPRQLFTVIGEAEPCVTYSYGIAAIVGDQMSEPSPMQEIVVPPRFGIMDRPSIEVLDNVNDTVNFVFNKGVSNSECQVEYYELRYSSLKTSDPQQEKVNPEDLDEDTRISLNFPGASGPGLNLEGRIKFLAHDTTTAWIQSQTPQIMSNGIAGGSSILVPIIIGILVGIVVLVIIVFFLVKKKRNQNKYDAEKASSDKDETQKLNADVPDS